MAKRWLSDESPPAVRLLARELGLRLELEPFGRALAIAAYDIQTDLRLVDLPEMSTRGCWQTWSQALRGLQALAAE